MFQDWSPNLGAVVGDKRLWRETAEENAARGNTLREHNVKHRQHISFSLIAWDCQDLHLWQSWSKPGRSECRERRLLPFDRCPSNKIVRPGCKIFWTQPACLQKIFKHIFIQDCRPPQETGELLSPPPGGPIGSWWTPLQKAKLIPNIIKTFCNVCQLSKLTPSAIRYLGRLLLLLLLANHLNNIPSSSLVKASDHHLQGERGVVRGAEPCVINLD